MGGIANDIVRHQIESGYPEIKKEKTKKNKVIKRWLHDDKKHGKDHYLEFICPDCGEDYSFSNRDIDRTHNKYQYCSSCGVKLDPPEMLMGVFEYCRYSDKSGDRCLCGSHSGRECELCSDWAGEVRYE